MSTKELKQDHNVFINSSPFQRHTVAFQFFIMQSIIKTNYRIWQDMQKRKCRSRNKVFILTVHPVFKGLEMESSSVIISSHRNCFNAIVDDQQHHGVKHHRHLGAWESHLKNGHPNQYITAPKLITKKTHKSQQEIEALLVYQQHRNKCFFRQQIRIYNISSGLVPNHKL